MKLDEKIDNLMNAESCIDDAGKNIFSLTYRNTKMKKVYDLILQAGDELEDWQMKLTSEDHVSGNEKSSIERKIRNAKSSIDNFLQEHEDEVFNNAEYADECLEDAIELLTKD